MSLTFFLKWCIIYIEREEKRNKKNSNLFNLVNQENKFTKSFLDKCHKVWYNKYREKGKALTQNRLRADTRKNGERGILWQT